jgi:hypothetical protein
MKLTEKAIEKILDCKNTRTSLCAEFDCSYHTMQRWVRDNKDNGELTTLAALEIILEHTGMKQEQVLDRNAKN